MTVASQYYNKIQNFNTEEEHLYTIALSYTPYIGSKNAKNLIRTCGSAKAVYEQNTKSLTTIPGIGDKASEGILARKGLKQAEKELNFATHNEIKVTAYTDPDFPTRLRDLPDSPTVLYSKGNYNFEAARQIAIVGTRSPSPYGVYMTQKLVEELSQYQVQIVSGLALGIDGTAHRSSTELGIANLGILGHGLQTIYPYVHKSLAMDMIQHTGSGIVTEYGQGIAPETGNFPARNRIIAGLCDAVIVVETNETGGSMITANIAKKYHKPVFALPGRVHDGRAAGCIKLLRNQEAHFLQSAQDIANLLKWGEEKTTLPKAQMPELDAAEQKLVELIQKKEKVDVNELILHTKMTNAEVASLLLVLELKGIVQGLPGQLYTLQQPW